MNIYKLVTYIIGSTLLCVLIIANVFVSGSLSTAGEELKDLENQKIALSEEIKDLHTSILNSSSLTSLQQRAEHLGYLRPEEVVSLDLPIQTVAMNH